MVQKIEAGGVHHALYPPIGDDGDGVRGEADPFSPGVGDLLAYVIGGLACAQGLKDGAGFLSEGGIEI